MTGRYDKSAMRDFCQSVLEANGMPEPDALIVADSLVRANLEGLDSHGVSRMPIYVRRMREGRIACEAKIEIVRDGSVLRVDGGNGLGQVAACRGLEAAIPVARECGIAGIAVRNSNHFGAASYYCQRACREAMALVATTNSPPGIAPWGGKKPYFGTNPIAFGFPNRREADVIVDMSSSVVARGKIILAARNGEQIPEGWAIDEDGLDTTDAAEALRGAVLPLGGAKGYALALAVELMSGVLSGAAFGPHVGNIYSDDQTNPADVGHLFIPIDIERWLPLDDYYERIESLLDEVKSSPRSRESEEILFPGERRYTSYTENSDRGIKLPRTVLEDLHALGSENGIAAPEAI